MREHHTELAQQRLTRKAWRLADKVADHARPRLLPPGLPPRVRDEPPARLARRVRDAAPRARGRAARDRARRAAPASGRLPHARGDRRAASPAATRPRTPATGSTASTSSRSPPGRASAAPAIRPPPARPSRTSARRCCTRARAPRPGPSAVARVTPMALRDEFPVLERIAYLNAGTDGPIPRAAVESARGELAAQIEQGRLWPHFERRRRAHGRPARRLRQPARLRASTTSRSPPARAMGSACVLAGHGHRPGRRDRHLRQRAPGPARAADRRPPPRRDGARGAVRRARRRRPRDHDARRRLARELDHGRGRARGAGRRSPCR